MSDFEYQSYAQLCQFLERQGRLPRLSDPIPAHRYAGWALPMIIEGHRTLPEVPDRWGYHLQILDTQQVPDDPIPQINFLNSPHPGTLKHLHRWISISTRHESAWTGLTRLIQWMAYALNVSPQPPAFDDAIQAQLYRDVNLLELVRHPYDYWGDIIAEGVGHGRWVNPNKFYPTPMAVCHLMAGMVLPDTTGMSPQQLKALRVKKVADPAGSGTGRMLLLASNSSLALYGCDIDPLVLTASLINGALYAPWLAFPIPEQILNAPGSDAETEREEATDSVIEPERLTPVAAAIDLTTASTCTTTAHDLDPATLQLVFPGRS